MVITISVRILDSEKLHDISDEKVFPQAVQLVNAA